MTDALRLPLRVGLDQQEITGVFGEPTGTERFVRDRVTLVFRIGAAESYELSCTVHEEHGLIYLTMHPTPLPDQLAANPIAPAVDDCCTSPLYKIEKAASDGRRRPLTWDGAVGNRTPDSVDGFGLAVVGPSLAVAGRQ
ncbi:hypothetical protein E1193_23570 [Micromonospora sp. KC606]|uniref:hypothetical protein n=1 Tax=Micromonospora sp. KC606 TaxID=2530379 RepID=UPI0010537964|nr:hypothetical protein [Micromonospora sp. KC606]TDC76622.1 hypothetical protein E1193_23570 [Micromonospora sp. KC606]